MPKVAAGQHACLHIVQGVLQGRKAAPGDETGLGGGVGAMRADGEGAIGTSHTTCTVSVEEFQQVLCTHRHSIALHSVGPAWNVVRARHMDPALKPTGDEPGAHWMPTMADPLLPTFKRESRSSPALHTALLVM